MYMRTDWNNIKTIKTHASSSIQSCSYADYVCRIAAKAQAEREANKEHMRRINREALAGIVAVGISEEQGKSLIKAISSGTVPHVSIKY